ncbi:MAG: GH92 family glycosyl hydrolase, partial [Pyrinomonadaceae bacterium]
HYTVFSLWDTFRAAHPLYTIIDQKRTVDFINTFIRMYEQGGRLPVWELWGEETDTMIGYHAVSVIADAMAKGIKGFDCEKAYAAAKHSADLDHFGLAAYKKRGYISSEDENESVSKTLEYAYNDWNVARIAIEMCREIDAPGCDRTTLTEGRVYHADNTKWARRAAAYQNLFDKQTGFMRPRRNGGWISPFKPNEVTFHFTEGNSWQYTFFVPQDISGLIELYGGERKFAAKLDELFTTTQPLTGREQPDITGLIGQYAHGNEPSHHIPYLFNYTDQPWKTQKYVRKIMDEFYKNSPDGLIGNEDCGQMSAWYVLSALGFYPVSPGDPTYQLGTPLFKDAMIRLENGKTFTIRAPAVSSKNIYSRRSKLNGQIRIMSPTSIEHAEIMRGGVLEFEMASEPDVPADLHDGMDFRTSSLGYVAVPVIDGPGRILSGNSSVSLKSITPNARIFYTLDGKEPSKSSTEYKGPFFVRDSSTVRAIAVTKDGQSLAAEARFFKRPNNWKVNIASPYSTQYTGGGDDGIIDGIRGTVNFASGEWQGYQGKTFEAVIDLQNETEITSVGGGFLQSVRSWIWMPDRLEFEVSSDGTNFVKIADITPAFPQQEMNTLTKDFQQAVARTKARYVRVRAYNLGKIPSWHPGAGGDPWIFVDEILIN